MDRGVAVILMALTGGLIALQPAINAGLGRATGSISAALVSFAIGTLLLAAIVVVSGQAGGLGSTFDVRWYYLLGGVLGAAYVFAALSTVGTIGAGGVAAATITGQFSQAGRVSISSPFAPWSLPADTGDAFRWFVGRSPSPHLALPSSRHLVASAICQPLNTRERQRSRSNRGA